MIDHQESKVGLSVAEQQASGFGRIMAWVRATASAILRWPARAITSLLILLIRLYQITLSPLLGQACRFEPTCSRYMVESLRKYGLAKGLGRGLRRVGRCHPWNPGGYDPP
jgi:putative membrane protein insertion efficiency factor